MRVPHVSGFPRMYVYHFRQDGLNEDHLAGDSQKRSLSVHCTLALDRRYQHRSQRVPGELRLETNKILYISNSIIQSMYHS